MFFYCRLLDFSVMWYVPPPFTFDRHYSKMILKVEVSNQSLFWNSPESNLHHSNSQTFRRGSPWKRGKPHGSQSFEEGGFKERSIAREVFMGPQVGPLGREWPWDGSHPCPGIRSSWGVPGKTRCTILAGTTHLAYYYSFYLMINIFHIIKGFNGFLLRVLTSWFQIVLFFKQDLSVAREVEIS